MRLSRAVSKVGKCNASLGNTASRALPRVEKSYRAFKLIPPAMGRGFCGRPVGCPPRAAPGSRIKSALACRQCGASGTLSRQSRRAD